MPALKIFVRGVTVTANLFTILNPHVVSLGYEIVDIENSTQYGQMHITVYIDKVPEGVSLEDCEKVHYAVESAIDEADPTDGQPYVLEISSPGLDRPFKIQRDYERNYGREVEVKLFAPLKGKKIYEGMLTERTETYVLLDIKGETCKIEANRIALVRPLVKFE